MKLGRTRLAASTGEEEMLPPEQAKPDRAPPERLGDVGRIVMESAVQERFTRSVGAAIRCQSPPSRSVGRKSMGQRTSRPRGAGESRPPSA
jgi:hypothetical protein